MAISSTNGEHAMNDIIYLPTTSGITSADMYAYFDSVISGKQFTFAVHQHLSLPTHLKISEMSTGKGIAEIIPTGSKANPQVPELLASARAAVTDLVQRLGEHIVCSRLDENARTAPILNGPGYEY